MTNAARDLFDWMVMPRFEAAQGPWIDRAKAAARKIAREAGRVTINDVRAVCPPPEGVDPRVMGAVFSGKEFERVGIENSNRRECHGRPLGIFKLRSA